jgi:hypothetical protein
LFSRHTIFPLGTRWGVGLRAHFAGQDDARKRSARNEKPHASTIVVQPSRLPKMLYSRRAGGTPAPQTWRGSCFNACLACESAFRHTRQRP